MPSSTAWSTTPTVSSCAATACAESGPRRLPRLDPDHPPDGDNHPPADERHPGRHQSERPADMILEPVADIAPEQAADIIGIRSLIEELVEQELEAALGRGRYERGCPVGHRHGHRHRRLTGSFGPEIGRASGR